MPAAPVTAPSLAARTVAVADDTALLPRADPRHPLLFQRLGDGVVGIGETLRLTFSGPSRMRDAADAWRAVAARASIDDAVGLPGSGLIAFGAFAFADSSAEQSVLIVPELVVGRRDGVTWMTRIVGAEPATTAGADAADADAVAGPASVAEPNLPPVSPWGGRFRADLVDGRPNPEGYREAVATAVARIRDGALSKTVLARTLDGRIPADADLRRVLAALALGYPDCHTYAVDGLIGSSPETLVRVDRGTVSARVLAGTMARGVDARSDEQAAAALATSTKDLDEHRFAVQSLLATLRPHCRTLSSDEVPFTLRLPNLWHLATDVEGDLAAGASSLDLIDALHPTAAVAGTPTDAALELLAELEGFDRGRYAGPVGWVGADGDGEWAIALRGAQVQGERVTAFAGAGIVADSDPDAELAETRMKFRPIREALAG